MTGRVTTSVVVLLAVALASNRGAAEELKVGGHVGFNYFREDWWNEGNRTGRNRVDWYADLFAHGTPFRPDLARFLLSLSYRGERSRQRGDKAGARVVAADFNASLLEGSRIPITFHAGRRRTDFFSREADDRWTGHTILTGLGGTTLYQPKVGPTAHLELDRSMVHNVSPLGDESDSNVTRLSSNLAQSARVLRYDLQYDTVWASGSLAQSDYRSHHFRLNVNRDLPGAEPGLFYVRQSFYLRRPTNDEGVNPDYDDNLVSTGIRWHPKKRMDVFLGYVYRRFLFDADAIDDLERLGHDVDVRVRYSKSDELELLGLAATGITDRTFADEHELATGGTAGGGGRWHRERDDRAYEASGTAVAGWRDTAETTDVAIGIAAHAGVTRAGTRWGATGFYDGVWQLNQAGSFGWSLSHRLTSTAHRNWDDTKYLRGQLTIAAARKKDDLVGTLATRSILLSADAVRDKLNALLITGMTEGLSPELENPNQPDGLLLPSDFNSRRLFVRLRSQRMLLNDHLGVRVTARGLWARTPAHTTQWEYGVDTIVVYVLGLVAISLEERVSIGGDDTRHQTANLVMLRITRAFEHQFF